MDGVDSGPFSAEMRRWRWKLGGEKMAGWLELGSSCCCVDVIVVGKKKEKRRKTKEGGGSCSGQPGDWWRSWLLVVVKEWRGQLFIAQVILEPAEERSTSLWQWCKLWGVVLYDVGNANEAVDSWAEQFGSFWWSEMLWSWFKRSCLLPLISCICLCCLREVDLVSNHLETSGVLTRATNSKISDGYRRTWYLKQIFPVISWKDILQDAFIRGARGLHLELWAVGQAMQGHGWVACDAQHIPLWNGICCMLLSWEEDSCSLIVFSDNVIELLVSQHSANPHVMLSLYQYF